ncbi:hypothetical protein D4R30_00825 [archaeon]|nr:MAG: hypothetical protein D4R30_00825 [archaeon]
MDLETFIAETLRQIVKGVRTAQQHEDCKGATINPPTAPGQNHRLLVKQIEFDVALTVSEGSEKQGKGNIGIASVFGIGGQANSTTASSSVSRIKFEVPVVLPIKGPS